MSGLIESDELPTTSQATPAAFDSDLLRCCPSGGRQRGRRDDLLSKLSGTYQSACIAAAEYDNIYVVDSKQRGYRLWHPRRATRSSARTEGMDAEDHRRNCWRKSATKFACIAPARHARIPQKAAGASRRLSRLRADFSTSSRSSPLVDGAEIQVIGKARGSKQGNNLLVQKIHESGGIDFDEPIILGYSGLSDSYAARNMSRTAATLWQRSRRTRLDSDAAFAA